MRKNLRGELGWGESIARERLLRLSALTEAWAGLKDHELHGTPPPDVPDHLQDDLGCRLAWETGPAGTLRAAVVMQRQAENDPKIKLHSRAGDVINDIRRLAVSALEHRRAGWQRWDPKSPKLPADQTRLLLTPLDGEDPLQRAVAVELRTGVNLDGTLRAETLRVVWTSIDEAGDYPGQVGADELLDETGDRRPSETRTDARLLDAARQVLRLYRVENLVPGDPANRDDTPARNARGQ